MHSTVPYLIIKQGKIKNMLTITINWFIVAYNACNKTKNSCRGIQVTQKSVLLNMYESIKNFKVQSKIFWLVFVLNFVLPYSRISSIFYHFLFIIIKSLIRFARIISQNQQRRKKDVLSLQVPLHEKRPQSELFWFVYSLIRTEYGEMRENTDQNNSKYGHF